MNFEIDGAIIFKKSCLLHTKQKIGEVNSGECAFWIVQIILWKSPLASNRRAYLSERRIHSARISRRGLEASLFISFLISESLKSSASFHFSSSFDSGRMKWISPFWERSLTKRDFGKLVRRKYGCNGKDKRVRAIWIKRLRQVGTPFTAFC